MPQGIKTTLDFLNTGRIINLPDGVDAQDAATVHQLGAGAGTAIWGGIAGSINDQTDLISGGKILPSLLPALAITDTYVVGSQVAMLALTAETGDIAVRTDETKTYILKGTDPSVLADWELLLTPTGGVVSVFGRSGAVTAQSGDYSFSLISGVVGTAQGGAPAGGATGYVLTKNSGADYDYSWAAAAGGIPSMTGNGGKFLTNDGTVASWASITQWLRTGNTATNPAPPTATNLTGTDYLGTADNTDFVIGTNNKTSARFYANNDVLFGAATITINPPAGITTIKGPRLRIESNAVTSNYVWIDNYGLTLGSSAGIIFNLSGSANIMILEAPSLYVSKLSMITRASIGTRANVICGRDLANAALDGVPFYIYGAKNTNNGSVGATIFGIDENGAERGKTGFGTQTPTALVHIKASSGAVNKTPLKLTAGTNVSTPEDGAFEYDGTHLYFTIGSTRNIII